MRHIGPISGIAAHANQFVATAGYDNQVILWDAVDRRAIARSFHDHLANQCSFSPSGRWLVSASSDHTARLWSVPELRLQAVLTGHDDDVEMASFSPDETRIATCSRDRTIRVYDLMGQFRGVCYGHSDDVLSVGWSDDGSELISSSDDGTVRRWNAHTYTELCQFDLQGSQTDTIIVTRDGTILAGDDQGRITLIHAGRITHYDAHRAGIKRMIWDEASQRLITLSYDRSMLTWLVSDAGITFLSKDRFPAIVWPRSGAFLGQDQLVFATFGSCYQIYNLQHGLWHDGPIETTSAINAIVDMGGKLYTVGDAGIVRCDGEPIAATGSLCNFLLPAGDALLTGGQMGVLFDALTGNALHQHRSPLNCGTILRKNGEEKVIVGSYTGEALIFSRESRQGGFVFERTMILHENAIKGLAANGETLFSVCASGAVALHSLDSDTPLSYHRTGHTRIANGCVAVKDGFASVGRDMRLRLWNGGGQTGEWVTPHFHSIKCIAASNDGLRIATGSYGGTIAVFNLNMQSWDAVARPTAAGISNIGVSATGFVACSYDGQIHHIT